MFHSYSHSLVTPFTKIEYLVKLFKEGTSFVDFNAGRILLDIFCQGNNEIQNS